MGSVGSAALASSGDEVGDGGVVDRESIAGRGACLVGVGLVDEPGGDAAGGGEGAEVAESFGVELLGAADGEVFDGAGGEPGVGEGCGVVGGASSVGGHGGLAECFEKVGVEDLAGPVVGSCAHDGPAVAWAARVPCGGRRRGRARGLGG